MTVERLLAEVSSHELSEWMACDLVKAEEAAAARAASPGQAGLAALAGGL